MILTFKPKNQLHPMSVTLDSLVLTNDDQLVINGVEADIIRCPEYREVNGILFSELDEYQNLIFAYIEGLHDSILEAWRKGQEWTEILPIPDDTRSEMCVLIASFDAWGKRHDEYMHRQTRVCRMDGQHEIKWRHSHPLLSRDFQGMPHESAKVLLKLMYGQDIEWTIAYGELIGGSVADTITMLTNAVRDCVPLFVKDVIRKNFGDKIARKWKIEFVVHDNSKSEEEFFYEHWNDERQMIVVAKELYPEKVTASLIDPPEMYQMLGLINDLIERLNRVISAQRGIEYYDSIIEIPLSLITKEENLV